MPMALASIIETMQITHFTLQADIFKKITKISSFFAYGIDKLLALSDNN